MKKNYIYRLALLLFAVTLGQSVKAQDNPEIVEFPLEEEDGFYLIQNAEDWNALAEYVAAGGETVEMAFKLTDDISVTTTMGCQLNSNATSRMRFAGSFDGGGHTLNVNLSSAETNPNYTAPFAYTLNATIKNLKVTGKITTTGTFAGGLVGSTGTGTGNGRVTIENVDVAVEMECNYLSGGQGSGKYANQAGFVGIAENGATITNCVFSGKLTGADFAYSGGFIALDKGKNTNITKLTNCFFVPSEVNAANLFGSSEFVHKDNAGGNAVLENCYYTVSFSEPETAQGIKVVTSYEEGDEVTPVAGPDGNTYYIVKHYMTWLDVQEQLAGTNDIITLTNDIAAGTEDTPLVVAEGRSLTIDLGGFTLDRAKDIVGAVNSGFVISNAGTLTIKNGTIRGGHNNGNGGGIFNTGTLTLEDVTVTGNYATQGAGVYSTGTLNVQGNVQVTGNNTGNVYINGAINVTGDLAETASIGVTTAANAAGTIVAVNGGGSFDATNFTSDNTSFHVAVYAEGEDEGKAYLSDAPAVEALLANLGDNSSILTEKNGVYADVTLSGRTISSGYWNTLCLPFDVTVAQLKKAIGNSVQVNELADASCTSSTLTINFAPLVAETKSIPAGTPFLVKGATKSSPKFEGVTIKNITNDVVSSNVTFKGTYSNTSLDANNQNIRFFGSNNKLYYPGSNGFTLGANRAYFVIDNGTEVKNFILNFGDEDDATAIMTIDNEQQATEGAIYNIAGQRISKMQKGINIVNGKKILF
ncbi:MAG: hypothetical protein IJK51_06465 [Bacteroidaceae bacterium]|nr:hypothetical protein [Bacteroidaceae bacterium]